MNDDTAAPLLSLEGTTMGTTWHAQLQIPRPGAGEALRDGISARLAHVVAQMSSWDPASALSRYNRAPAGSLVVMPQQIRYVLACATAVAQASGGAFDPTIGPLVGLWGFGAAAAARGTVSTARLQQAHARVDWRRLHWQQDKLLQTGDIALDLSAIAKGFAADDVACWLRGQGVVAGLVDIGGDIHAFGGRTRHSPWRIRVESAPDDDRRAPVPTRGVGLRDFAIATSGDRWHRYQQDGRVISHGIDPRTGQPVAHALSAVTVAAADAMHADAWATALTVLGPDAGMALAKRLGLAARFLQRGVAGPVETMTPGFTALLC